MLCSLVLDSTCDVHEDQVVDEVGVEKLTSAMIFDEYMWEYEEEVVVIDDLLLSAPHQFYLGIFYDSTFFYFSCENSSRMSLLVIIHKTHKMSVRHLIVERTNISF